MRKYFKIAGLILFLGSTASYAQVGMMTNNPNKDAVLDLNTATGDNSKGLLLPKVALLAADNPAPMLTHTAGMKVYNTAVAGSGVTAVQPGEYYNNGIKWVRLASILNIVDGTDAWLLGGNTVGATKVLGTKDNQPLSFIIDNTNAGTLAKTATAVGYNTLNPTTAGANNTAVGAQTLNPVTVTGLSNTAVGNSGLSVNTSGSGNTAFGDLALKANTTGLQNTALGANVMEFNIVGESNVGIGRNALQANIEGNFNVAVGTWALKGNTTGSYNVILGSSTFYASTSSSYNTAIGASALSGKPGGDANIALGNGALYSSIAASSGNIGIGYLTQYATRGGTNNISLGYKSFYYNTTGTDNIAIGNEAMTNTTTASFNIAIGMYGLRDFIATNNTIAIGSQAGGSTQVKDPLDTKKNVPNTKADNSIFIGSAIFAKQDNDSNEIIMGSVSSFGWGTNTAFFGYQNTTSIGGQKDWSNPSDFRLKKDIKDSEFGLNFITKLRPVTYFMKSGTINLQTGFIAQEVEAAANSINYQFNGIVKPKNADAFYSLRYSEFVVPLVKAVQEQQKEVAVIDTKLLDIENRLQKLESIVNELAKKK